jgi:superfamily II DNA or RNA helicase
VPGSVRKATGRVASIHVCDKKGKMNLFFTLKHLISQRGFFVLLALVCSNFVLADVTREQLEEAWQAVWNLHADVAAGWTAYERRGWQGQVPERLRWESADTVLVSYRDRFHPLGMSQIRIHLNDVPPRDQFEFINTPKDPAQVTLNGVRFYSRTSENFVIRDVYLGDVVDKATLQDRLRLSVNDNEVLNPWLRSKVQELREEWKDPHEIRPSIPQKEGVDFLMSHWHADTLRLGALVQMPTGMGKTEEVLFFLRELERRNQTFRLLWMVRGIDLVDQSRNRFDGFFKNQKEKTLSWHHETVRNREEGRQISHGAVDHIFVSMDTLPNASPQRALLSRWFRQKDNVPVIVVADESHQLGAPTYKDLYEWLWQDHEQHIRARIGLTATPIYSELAPLKQFYGNRVHFALIDPTEMDPEAGVPAISFLGQTLRAASRGYLSIPLFYPLSREPFENVDDNTYTHAELEDVTGVLHAFHPLKAMIFHPPGVSDEHGATGRMRQFHRYLETERPLGDIPTMMVSGEDERDYRNQVFEQFATQTTQGVMNLTQVGGVGLDIADVNTVLMLSGGNSLLLAVQRGGRPVRLAAGKPFARLVDWTGENFPLLFNSMAEVIGLSQGNRGTRIRELKQELEEHPEREAVIAQQIYEVLGIPPGLISADSKFFRRVLAELSKELIAFQVLPPVEQRPEHGVVFPENRKGERIRGYFRREDVIECLRQAVRWGADANIFDLTPGQVADALADIIRFSDGVTGEELKERLRSLWANMATGKKTHSVGKTQFFIVAESEQKIEGGVVFPPVEESEKSLAKYLARPAVIEVLKKLMGLKPDGDIFQMPTFQVAKQIAKVVRFSDEPDEERAIARIARSWTIQVEDATGKKRERPEFTVVSATHLVGENESGFPTSKKGESVPSYLRRADVLAALRKVTGLNDSANVFDLSQGRVGDVLAAVSSFSDGPDEAEVKKRISAAWNFVSKGKKSTAWKKTEFTIVTVDDSGRDGAIGFPPSAEGEGLVSYMRRPEVLARLGTAAGRGADQNVFDLTPNQVVEILYPWVRFPEDVDETEARKKLYQAWHHLSKRRKTDSDEEKWTFSVLPIAQQISPYGVKFPDVGEKPISLQAYMNRPDVLESLRWVNSLNAADNIFDLFPGAVADALIGATRFSDSPGTDDAKGRIARGWVAVSSGRKTKSGSKRSFSILPTGKQKGFPTNKEGEALAGYLRRPDVLEALRVAAGLPSGADVFAINRGRVADILVGIVKFSDDPAPAALKRAISGAWYNASRARQTSSPQPTAPIWPTSPSVKDEFRRIELLHLAVAIHVVRRMQNDPTALTFFIGRDADDFLITARQMAASLGLKEVQTRLRRLLFSNRLFFGNPSNPNQLANISEEQILLLLKSQGLSAPLIAGQHIYFFDIGFEGHSLRPVLATLLRASRLSPREFRKRVKAEFLLSRPETPVLTEGSDGLEHWDSRWWKKQAEVQRKWEAFNQEYAIAPEGARLKYLRFAGIMPMDEFPLAEAFRDAIAGGLMNMGDVRAQWDSERQSLLRDPVYFRDWLETFVEGKGLQIVTGGRQELHESIRRDLARAHGRVSNFRVGIGDSALFEYEQSHLTEAMVSVEAELNRQAVLCRVILEGAPSMLTRQEGD